MQKKKSYMNQKNILNEGLLDKIFDYIKKRKVRRLNKAFRDQPAVRKKINDLNNCILEFFGFKVPITFKEFV